MEKRENYGLWLPVVAGILFWIAILMVTCCSAGAEEVQGLVVNERDGWVYVNTSPYQIKKLDPWKQPRLSFQVQWFGEFEQMQMHLHFIYYSRNQKAPLSPEVEWKDDYGEWHSLEPANDREKGLGGAIVVSFTLDNVQSWAYSKELRFRVGGMEFQPAREEHENMLQLAWLCGRR